MSKFIETIDDLVDLVNVDHIVTVARRPDSNDERSTILVCTLIDGTEVLLDAGGEVGEDALDWFTKICG